MIALGGIAVAQCSVAFSANINDNVAWAIGRAGCSADCPIYTWTGSNWQPVSGAAQHVAVSPDGTNIYVVNHFGTIYKWNGSAFSAFYGGGCASAGTPTLGNPTLGAADNDFIWVIGCDAGAHGNNVYNFTPQGSTWTQTANASGVAISVTSDGTPWLIDSNNTIYEYISTWQSMGPYGFAWTYTNQNPPSTVNEIWAGEIHDVDASNIAGTITIGARSGGVLQNPQTLGWISIADVGAGTQANGLPPAPGPVNSVGTVAENPVENPMQTVVVGTGVTGSLNGPFQNGNGIWVTHEANATIVPWVQSQVHTVTGQLINPTVSVKVRFSLDGSHVYALTQQHLYVSTDNGNTFNESGACALSGALNYTDLAVDPNPAHPLVVYMGVSGQGVSRTIDGGTSCQNAGPPPLYDGGTPSTITNVALAIANVSNTARIYAAFAGDKNVDGNDFQNIDVTTATSWGGWSVVQQPIINGYGLQSQGSHDWSLGIDPTGSTLLLGGQALWRGTTCTFACVTFAQVNQGIPTTPDHHDYHAITWNHAGTFVYVVNDGGIFSSIDNGVTWNDQINNHGVLNATGVDVIGSGIFVSAWDNGGIYSLDMGTTWLGDQNIDGFDAIQAVADQSSIANPYGFVLGYLDGGRYAYTGSWNEIDHYPIQANAGAYMAKGRYRPLFTGGTNGTNFLYQSTNSGGTWSTYPSSANPLPAVPLGLVVSNETTPTVYVADANNRLDVSVSGGAWQPPIAPPFPGGYVFASSASTYGGPTALIAVDRTSHDFYAVGAQSGSQTTPVVFKSPAASHGTVWVPLTGPGQIPGRVAVAERPTALGIDSSSRAVLVGTDGRATSNATYGATTLYRLNNADVGDGSHHWRPWMNGLPAGMQPISWMSGQYENGVFYYYVATWGRGIWKREARGGDY
jgi:hypothetical protein